MWKIVEKFTVFSVLKICDFHQKNSTEKSIFWLKYIYKKKNNEKFSQSKVRERRRKKIWAGVSECDFVRECVRKRATNKQDTTKQKQECALEFSDYNFRVENQRKSWENLSFPVNLQRCCKESGSVSCDRSMTNWSPHHLHPLQVMKGKVVEAVQEERVGAAPPVDPTLIMAVIITIIMATKIRIWIVMRIMVVKRQMVGRLGVVEQFVKVLIIHEMETNLINPATTIYFRWVVFHENSEWKFELGHSFHSITSLQTNKFSYQIQFSPVGFGLEWKIKPVFWWILIWIWPDFEVTNIRSFQVDEGLICELWFLGILCE